MAGRVRHPLRQRLVEGGDKVSEPFAFWSFRQLLVPYATCVEAVGVATPKETLTERVYLVQRSGGVPFLLAAFQ